MKAPAEPARFVDRGEAAARLPLRLERRDPFVDALALATTGHGMTSIAIPVPMVATAALIRQCPPGPLVAWSSPATEDSPRLTVVGFGCARELRASGPERWQRIADASAIRIHGAIQLSSDDTEPTDIGFTRGHHIGARPLELTAAASLGFARPRFFGGAAFSPGAADRSPWTGFGDAWFVLPRWTYVSDGASARLVLAIDETDARDAARWRDELASLDHAIATAVNGDLTGTPPELTIAAASPELWRAQVEAITSAIAAGSCSKIVAARTCIASLAGDDRAISSEAHRAADLFGALEQRHPDCVRLLVRPSFATLVAATPERLVRRDGETIACDALAGTIRFDAGETDAAGRLLASTKDRREHDLVVDAIRTALTELGATIDAPAEPRIKRLRHVLHLHTPFTATTTDRRHVLELVARLHPTPAVGGTPTELAIDWIRDHEPVPRGWYASPVGWFDLDGNGDFAVAIRSGVIAGDRVHLWAGAGIVSGSDPDRELAETELKLRAMLGALGVAP